MPVQIISRTALYACVISPGLLTASTNIDAVHFLNSCEAQGIGMVNCSLYIYRASCFLRDDQVRFTSRNQRNLTKRFDLVCLTNHNERSPVERMLVLTAA